MTRAEVRTLLAAVLVLLASGVLLAVSRRLLVSDDPFVATGAGWDPWVLKAHVLGAPVFLFLFGGIYRRHVVAKLRDREPRGRASGLATLWLIALATATGYGLQVLSGEWLRNASSWLHLGFGGAFAIATILHARLGPASALASARAAARRPSPGTRRPEHDRTAGLRP